MDRPVGDLDVCIPINHKDRGLAYLNRLKFGIFSWFNTIKPENNHYRTNIDGVEICIFLVKQNVCLSVEYKNKNIRLSYPEEVIDAKKKYLESYASLAYFQKSVTIMRDKHKYDIIIYEKNKVTANRAIKIREFTGDIKKIIL